MCAGLNATFSYPQALRAIATMFAWRVQAAGYIAFCPPLSLRHRGRIRRTMFMKYPDSGYHSVEIRRAKKSAASLNPDLG